MDARPTNVIAASALAIIGGIVAIASIAWSFNPNSENIILQVGLALLISVFFFSVGGSLYTNGSGTWKSIQLVCFMNAAILLFAILYGMINLYFGIILLVMILLTAVLTANQKTAKWIEMDRI